jgi:hypothetical protein
MGSSDLVLSVYKVLERGASESHARMRLTRSPELDLPCMRLFTEHGQDAGAMLRCLVKFSFEPSSSTTECSHPDLRPLVAAGAHPGSQGTKLFHDAGDPEVVATMQRCLVFIVHVTHHYAFSPGAFKLALRCCGIVWLFCRFC